MADALDEAIDKATEKQYRSALKQAEDKLARQLEGAEATRGLVALLNKQLAAKRPPR